MATSNNERIRIRYLIGGLAIGAFWFLNRDRPAWEEALRTLATFAVLLLLLNLHLKRRPRNPGTPPIKINFVGALAAKAALVAVAALAESILGHWMTSPAVVISIALAVAVALLGPLLNHRLVHPTAPAVPISGSIR